ncbi:helix-turn-helix transcriptional regulator [Murimonas intestini]|uniref:DNA-binding XRE family transcriptional regulator n=1 Tax=Murimonas intestini TaxID=1337051 RepID=A0AB73SZE3_9FIRM|nr:helix-turn-helix transcriptional regulator [Murimonas intestini]MCR1842794.1 helix-turn-helix domain-containing protein [Murimonas intestini]MCR1867867.1 helix-turn-helix domain-containing protein [Murimonas intestini]MCR1885218.1 helix-turn-helix domain-containing protein [Murimonas intestini]
MVREELAKRLKYYRELNNMTVYEVGNAVGKSGKTISAWETGRGQPDADMLIVLCRLYHIHSVADLYGEEAPLLSVDEKHLVDTFRSLNNDGRNKLLERASELLELGYVKGESEKMA